MKKIEQILSYINNKNFILAKKELAITSTRDISEEVNYSLMGIIEGELSNFQQSVNYFKKAVIANPRNIVNNFNLAIAYGKNSQSLLSIQEFKKCIVKNYKIIDCILDISKQLTKKKKFYFAKKILITSLNKNTNEEILYNLAFIFFEENNINDSIKYITKAININPNKITFLFLYASILKKNNQFEESIEIYKKILSIDNNNFKAHLNLANLYCDIDKNDNAIEYYKKSLLLNNDNHDAKLNLSYILLKKKTINKDTIQNFEKRFTKNNPVISKYNLQKNLWDGSFIKNLLIWGEQGLGDHIFFSKYLTNVVPLANKIIFQTDKRLFDLFKNYFNKNNINNIEINDINKINKNYDLHIPIGSLMNVLNIKPFEYLNPKKFLEADQNMIGEFSKTINAKNLNVGISWKSLNPDQPHRNINISLLLNSLKKIPNIKIHNLQFGLDKGEIDNININKLVYYKNVDYKNDLNTIAAIIENMDFVITIQNTVAHLSCALQKKTLLLLPMGSRWYWGLENFDRWYGCAKIFRQKKKFDWLIPLNELIKYLKNEIKH